MLLLGFVSTAFAPIFAGSHDHIFVVSKTFTYFDMGCTRGRNERSELEEVEVKLRPMLSRPDYLRVGLPFGAHD
jgi:hypothetical protein